MLNLRAIAILAAIVPILALRAETRDAQYQTVTVTATYTKSNQSQREWRAFLQALDRCHGAGYRDAELAEQPQRRCKVGDAANCSEFEVTLRYDCIGMGYQPF